MTRIMAFFLKDRDDTMMVLILMLICVLIGTRGALL